MIEQFNEIKEIYSNKFAESALGKKAMDCKSENLNINVDKPLSAICDIVKNCPIENGTWSGERGNSTWIPDKDYIPGKSNPEGKTWAEILKKYNIDGINFKDGEPDFSEVSKGDVKIEGFSDNRADNFSKADIELAKQRNCTPEEVRKWRKENGYTWHECKDMQTMQKVASVVHNNIPHSGGISAVKKGA